MCGGDALAGDKQAAAQQQLAQSKELTKIATDRNAVQQPFETSRVTGGLPYKNQLLDYNSGILAKSYAPVRADLNRRLAGQGDTLPSGFANQSRIDLDSNRANAFDNNVISTLNADEQTKENAAAQLNPLGYYGSASGSAGSVLSAPPVAAGGVGNFIGGAASGLLNNASYGSGGVWSL